MLELILVQKTNNFQKVNPKLITIKRNWPKLLMRAHPEHLISKTVLHKNKIKKG